MIDQIVRRSVELDQPVEQAWHLLSDPAELARWLGEFENLSLEPGWQGRLCELDGTERVVEIDAVETGIGIVFTWWKPEAPAHASSVELLLEHSADGGSRLTVTERPVVRGGRHCATTAVDAGWNGRLLSFELASLASLLPALV